MIGYNWNGRIHKQIECICTKIYVRSGLISISNKIDERSEWASAVYHLPSAICAPKDLIWLAATGMEKYTSKASILVPIYMSEASPIFFLKLNKRSRLISISTNSGRYHPGCLWVFGGQKNFQEENIYMVKTSLPRTFMWCGSFLYFSCHYWDITLFVHLCW